MGGVVTGQGGNDTGAGEGAISEGRGREEGRVDVSVEAECNGYSALFCL